MGGARPSTVALGVQMRRGLVGLGLRLKPGRNLPCAGSSLTSIFRPTRVMLVLPVPPGDKGLLVCRVCPESVVLPACQVPRVTEYVSPQVLMLPLGPLLLTSPVCPPRPPLPSSPQGWDGCTLLSPGGWGGGAQCHRCPHWNVALGETPHCELSLEPGRRRMVRASPREDEEPGVPWCCGRGHLPR